MRTAPPGAQVLSAAACAVLILLGPVTGRAAAESAAPLGDGGVPRAAAASPKPAAAPAPPELARPLCARDVSVLLRAVSAALSENPAVTVSSIGLAVKRSREGTRASANLSGKSASPPALSTFVAALGRNPALEKAAQLGGKPVSSDVSGPLTFLVFATLADRPGEPVFSPLPPGMHVRREIGRAAEVAGLGMLQMSPGGAAPPAAGGPAGPERDVLLIEAGGEMARLIRFFDALATLPELGLSGIGIQDVMREGGGRPESTFTASFSATIPKEKKR